MVPLSASLGSSEATFDTNRRNDPEAFSKCRLLPSSGGHLIFHLSAQVPWPFQLNPRKAPKDMTRRTILERTGSSSGYCSWYRHLSVSLLFVLLPGLWRSFYHLWPRSGNCQCPLATSHIGPKWNNMVPVPSAVRGVMKVALFCNSWLIINIGLGFV